MSVNEVIALIIGILESLGLMPIITAFFAFVFTVAGINYLLGRR